MQVRRLKIPAIIVGVIVLLLGALTFILPAMINTDPIIAALKQEVEAITGRELVLGKVTVSVVPAAKISIDGVALRNDELSSKNHFLRANKLVIHLNLIDALTGGDAPSEANIELIAPHIELERFRDGNANWEFLNTQKQTPKQQTGFRLLVVNGTASFTHHQQDYFETLSGINGDLRLSLSQATVTMSGMMRKEPMGLNANCKVHQFGHLASYDMECSSELKQANNVIGYKGRVLNREGAVVMRGKVDVKAEDSRQWIDVMMGKGKSPFGAYYTKPFPLTLSADTYADDSKLVINLLQISSQNSSGKGAVSADFSGNDSRWTVNLWFDSLDIDQIRPEHKGRESVDIFALNQGFPAAIDAQITLQAKAMTFHEVAFADVVAKADMGDGEIVVSNLTMKTPAEGNLITLGRLVSKADGLEYDGQVEAYGESLRALAPLMGIALADIPEDAFGQFRSRFNLIARPSLTTISELRLVTGDNMQLAGGVNIYHGGANRVDATVGLRNFDFAPFEALWLQGHHLFANPQEVVGHPFGFEWLKTLDKHINLIVKLDNYQLLGLKGAPTELKLSMAPNELQASDINAQWGGSRISGQIALQHLPNAERPFVTSQLMISDIRLGNAFLDTMRTSGDETMVNKGPWSNTKRIGFWPLHYFDGEADLRIRRIEHDSATVYNLRAMAKLKDFRLQAENMEFGIWGAAGQANLAVESAVVPSLDISFGIQNAQLKELLASFVDYSNLNGTISLSGKIGFSGLNYADWIKDIKGYVTLDARSVFVQEFNLPAVVRAIASVRAVSGLANSIRLAQDKGASRIDNINGTAAFANGQLTITRLTMRANESVGEISGSMDLQNWLMQLTFKFGLITLAQSGYPFLYAHLTGPIDAPELRLDAKEVEAFLARNIR